MKRPKSKVWGTLSFFVLYVACLCYELLHNQCGTETCWPMICPILTCQTFSSWAQLEHQSKTTCTKMSEVQINFNRTILEPFKLQFFFTNTKVQYFFVYSLILNANTTLPKTVFLYIGHLLQSCLCRWYGWHGIVGNGVMRSVRCHTVMSTSRTFSSTESLIWKKNSEFNKKSL